ncbi:hypothetical protein EYF80_048323 [Liparis tanakae]|uniref:Uncharacterized protein n=1 Tax=Liparis tanakae TaxID=230148 RepID=A0A4Z2FJW4_9TELE|nr:hypothetical protein EYF80_048323 [Liparis tanakae]
MRRSYYVSLDQYNGVGNCPSRQYAAPKRRSWRETAGALTKRRFIGCWCAESGGVEKSQNNNVLRCSVSQISEMTAVLTILIGVLKTADQTDRSDDITSARNTIRDVSIAVRRNGDDAPAECRRVRGPRGDPHAASGVPSPEFNLWVNSPTLACLSPYRLMLTCLSPYRLMFTAHAFHRERLTL